MRQQSYEPYIREVLREESSQEWLQERIQLEQSWSRLRAKYGIEPNWFSVQQTKFLSDNPETVEQLVEACSDKDLNLTKPHKVAAYLKAVSVPYLSTSPDIHPALTDTITNFAAIASSSNRIKEFARKSLSQLVSGDDKVDIASLETLSYVIQQRYLSHGKLTRLEFSTFTQDTLPLLIECLSYTSNKDIQEVTKSCFYTGNQYKSLHEFHAQLKARSNGHHFVVDREIRLRFERAGLSGADYIIGLQKTLEGGRLHPLDVFPKDDLCDVLDIALDAGLCGKQFEVFVTEVVPALGECRTTSRFESTMKSLLRAAVSSGFGAASQDNATLATLKRKHVTDTSLNLGLLDFCRVAVPKLQRLLTHEGGAHLQLLLERFEQGTRIIRSDGSMNPLADKLSFWNFMVHALPDDSKYYRYTRYGNSPRVSGIDEEQKDIATLFGLISREDLGVGLCKLLSAYHSYDETSRSSYADILEPMQEMNLAFHPAEFDKIVRLLAQSRAFQYREFQLFSHLEQLQEHRELCLEHYLTPLSRSFHYHNRESLSLSQIIDAFQNAVSKTPRSIEPLLKHAFSPLCERGYLCDVDTSLKALRELCDYGEMGEDFWRNVGTALSYGGSARTLEERPEQHFLIGALLEDSPNARAVIHEDYFSTNRDGLRALAAYMSEPDPHREELFARLGNRSGEEIRQALEARSLLLRQGLFPLPDGEEDIVTLLQNESYRYATRLMRVPQSQVEMLQDDLAHRGNLLREMLAAFSLNNISLSEEDKDRRVSSLLRDFVLAYNSDWRKWRYHEAAGQLQLAPLTLEQQRVWQENTINTLFLDWEQEHEIEATITGSLVRLELHVTEQLRHFDPHFRISREYVEEISKEIAQRKHGPRAPSTSKRISRCEDLRTIVTRMLQLQEIQLGLTSPDDAQRLIGSMRQSLRNLKQRRGDSELRALSDAIRERATINAPQAVYCIERDDLVSLLDVQDAIKTCMQWENQNQASVAILHFASDANVKKLQLVKPVSGFTLRPKLPKAVLEECFANLFGYRWFELRAARQISATAWELEVCREQEEGTTQWYLQHDPSGMMLHLYESSHSGQSRRLAHFFTRTSRGAQGGAYEVYLPGREVLARQYFRVAKTERDVKIFSDTVQPVRLPYARAFEAHLAEKAQDMGVRLYGGGYEVVEYPPSRNVRIYSPAIFGDARVPKSYAQPLSVTIPS